MDRHGIKRVRLAAAVFLSAGAGSFAAAAPASAATPVIMPPSISCQGVVSAINGSGFNPGALVQIVEPVTGAATPPIPAGITGNVGLPSFTIPGAQYLPGSQFVLDVLQSSTKVGTFPVQMPNVCPSIAPFQGASTAPAVATSTASASASSTSTEAVSAPTQPAATPSFTAGSGSTGDDAAMRHTSSTTPLVVGAVVLAGVAAAAGAVSLRKGRVSQ